MNKITIEEVLVGQRFNFYHNNIYFKLKADKDTEIGEFYECWSINHKQVVSFHQHIEVNTDWWEALEDPTRIDIMQAWEDGAVIQYCGSITNHRWEDILNTVWKNWNWSDYIYRIKPSTHIIKIDDKEIELSEESYKNLKQSLNE